MKTPRLQNLFRIGAVAAALAIGGVAAQAQPAPGGPGGPGRHGGPDMMAPGSLFGGHMEHVLELVNATDSQRSQIDAIFKAARTDLAGQRDAGRKAHEQMLALYTAPNVDAAAIEALRQQMSAQREVAGKRFSQASIDAARVLTPEQRAKMADLMKKRQARMAKRAAD